MFLSYKSIHCDMYPFSPLRVLCESDIRRMGSDLIFVLLFGALFLVRGRDSCVFREKQYILPAAAGGVGTCV